MEDIVLKLTNLNKFYGKFHAIKDISFEISKGEIVGFIGPNGSGKSTTMKCICNLIYPESGQIEICGWNLKTDRNKALSNIAALIESPGLYYELSGQDNLELFAGLKGVGKQEIEDAKEFINIGDSIYRKVNKYSMGMKQRLAIGICLLSNPKLLILDEPTNGLDPSGIIELRNNLLSLASTRDISILFSSHQLGEIEKITDRIIGIKEGKIVSFTKEDSLQVNYEIEMEDHIEETLFDDIEGIINFSIKDKIIDITLNHDQYLQTILDSLSINNKILRIENKHISIEDIYLEVFGDKDEENI